MGKTTRLASAALDLPSFVGAADGVTAMAAVSGRGYLVDLSTGPVLCEFAGRTKGGCAFRTLDGSGGVLTLMPEELVVPAEGAARFPRHAANKSDDTTLPAAA